MRLFPFAFLALFCASEFGVSNFGAAGLSADGFPVHGLSGPGIVRPAPHDSHADGAPGADQELVARALANEVRAAMDTRYPMRYLLRKVNSTQTIVKEIIETSEGSVAHLVSINDAPLRPEAALKEQTRLDRLLNDPERQRHRQQAESADLDRALKVLRALPQGFVYEHTETKDSIARFTFRPNPEFHSQSLETLTLGSMTGELWVNTEQERVIHLEGHLQQDVDFGWGILGRLNKGGWIAVDQAEIAPHRWRNVRFKMVMSGRVLYKNKVFDTVEYLTHFAPVSSDLDYRQGIQLLRDKGAEAYAQDQN